MSEIVKKLIDEATNLDMTASMYTPGLQINRNNPYAGRMAEVCRRAAAKLRESAEAIAALQTVGERGNDYAERILRCAKELEEPMSSLTTASITQAAMFLRVFAGNVMQPTPAPVAVTDAMRDVTAERRRQVEKEGWSPDHDDCEHANGELALAASVYAHPRPRMYSDPRITTPIDWPAEWQYNPKGRRRNLVRSGALILAEIERLDREAALSGQEVK